MKKIQFSGNKNIIFDLLRKNRLANKLTQGQLAAKMQAMGVNIDQQMISKIEHNQRFVTDYELACFCEILRIDYSELFENFRNNYRI